MRFGAVPLGIREDGIRKIETARTDLGENGCMSCTHPETEFEALVYLADRLRVRFPESNEEAVFALIAEELESFDGVRLRAYVPVLVERNVVRRLHEAYRLAA